METTREMMVEEGAARMVTLKMLPQPIKEFREEGRLNLSENGGYLYWLNDEQQKLVKDWEEENECIVYHVIHDFTNFGEMLTFLYVSKYKEEWEMDREDLKAGYPLAYVMNLTMPDCSEFGSVGVQPSIGGVKRVS